MAPFLGRMCPLISRRSSSAPWRSRPCVYALFAALEGDRGRGRQAGRIRDRAGSAASFGNLMSEIIGTFILVLGILAIGANELTAGSARSLSASYCQHRLVAGRNDRVRNQSRARPRPQNYAYAAPIPGKGGSNWGYAWVPVAGPMIGAHWADYSTRRCSSGKRTPSSGSYPGSFSSSWSSHCSLPGEAAKYPNRQNDRCLSAVHGAVNDMNGRNR